MGLIELIESSGIASFVRESPSIFGYTLVLSLHAMGLAIVVGLNWVVALRLLGVAPSIPLAPALSLFPAMYAGFWINAISGLLLLAAHASSMLANTMFYIKLAFIALAVLSLRMIRNKVFTDNVLQAGGQVPDLARKLAWASVICWLGAIIAGRLTAYPYFVEAWFGI